MPVDIVTTLYGRQERSWQLQANCMGVDPDLFFPERGASTELAEFYGSAFPFSKTREARIAANDPRPSIAERYASREDYLKRVHAAAEDLIQRRFVLPQDRDYIVERAARLWDAVAQ